MNFWFQDGDEQVTSQPQRASPKAAVNAPQSRRFAQHLRLSPSRSVWTARVFSTALPSLYPHRNCPRGFLTPFTPRTLLKASPDFHHTRMCESAKSGVARCVAFCQNYPRLVDGVLAQLVERLVRNEKVRSSSLLGSTSLRSSLRFELRLGKPSLR